VARPKALTLSNHPTLCPRLPPQAAALNVATKLPRGVMVRVAPPTREFHRWLLFATQTVRKAGPLGRKNEDEPTSP
jgi:hypothetical protein